MLVIFKKTRLTIIYEYKMFFTDQALQIGFHNINLCLGSMDVYFEQLPLEEKKKKKRKKESTLRY